MKSEEETESREFRYQERIARMVLIKTKSRGTIRIPLSGLSEEDRQEIKELIESRFCE
jgi:hypothetical protein